MLFEPRKSGNPAGRPKGSGSGRVQALGVLDRLLAEPGAQAALRDGLRAELLAPRPRFSARTRRVGFPSSPIRCSAPELKLRIRILKIHIPMSGAMPMGSIVCWSERVQCWIRARLTMG